MQRIVHDAPRSIRESNLLIPEWLEEFILRLMSKERADRFATADEVVRILQGELAYLQNPGLTPVRLMVPRGHRPSIEISGKRQSTIVVGGILGLATVGISLVAWFWQDVRLLVVVVPRSQASAPLESGTPTIGDSDRSRSTLPCDDDDVIAAQAAAIRIDEDLRGPSIVETPDPWEIQIIEFRRRMTEILEEYEGLVESDIRACLLFASRALESASFMPLAEIA